jgi:hypothetical protein
MRDPGQHAAGGAPSVEELRVGEQFWMHVSVP